MTARDSVQGQNSAIRLLVLEGDGIGPEIVQATLTVLNTVAECFDLKIDYSRDTIGFESLRSRGTTFHPDVLAGAKEADGVILGPVQHNDYPPLDQGGINPSGALRKGLDLFANIRPAKTYPGFNPPCGKPFDLVICRENTEGFYADRSMYLGNGEFMPTPDLALSVRKITRHGCERIAQRGFELAMRRRKKVTAVHKANVLRVSDGLFLESVRKIAANFPNVVYEEKIVDAMAALLIRDAGQFDVIVATNMFGDILSDQVGEMSGSLGLAGSINASHEHAIAQAQHGSAPDIAGQDKANPSSLIASVAMLLQWLGERRSDQNIWTAGELISSALTDTIAKPEWRTADMGGPLGTRAFGERVASAVSARARLA